MMSPRSRLGVGSARVEGIVIGLVLLVAALAVKVEAQNYSPPSYTLFNWPDTDLDYTEYDYGTPPNLSATNFNGFVYVIGNFSTPTSELVLLKMKIDGADGSLSNFSKVGQASPLKDIPASSQPASCVFNNNLYYFYTAATSDKTCPVWYGCYGNYYFQQNQVNLVACNTSYVAAAVCDGTMFVFTQSSINGVSCVAYSTSTDGWSWTAPVVAQTITSDLKGGVAAASFYDNASGNMKLMLVIAAPNPPYGTGIGINTYVWDGSNFSSTAIPYMVFGYYNITGLTLQNGTIQGGATADAMQMWYHYTETEHDGIDYAAHMELTLGPNKQWTTPDRLHVPFHKNSAYKSDDSYCYGLCSAVVGGYDASSNTMRQYINVIGVSSPDDEASMVFAGAYTSDQLVYDPSGDGMYDVASSVGTDSEVVNQQLVTAIVPLGFVAGLPPFTYNGWSVTDAANTFQSLSALAFGNSTTTGMSSTTTWSGSVSVGVSSGIKDVYNIGLTFGSNLSHSVVTDSSVTKNQTDNFNAPRMVNGENNNGDWGFFFYQAPTLSHHLYKRFAWDGSTPIQPDFHYVFVSSVSLNSFNYQLADPSQTDPPGFQHLTQGMKPLWSSTDLTSWAQNNGTINGQVSESNNTTAGTMTVNGVDIPGEDISWTNGQTDTNQHGFSLAITGSVGPELFNGSLELQGSVNYSTSNSTSTSSSGAMTLQLPGIPTPPPLCPTYNAYNVTPYWLQPDITVDSAPSWMPTNCQNIQNFFCLTYVVNATPNNCGIMVDCVPCNSGTAAYTPTSDAYTYNVTASPASNSYAFSNWTVTSGGATIAEPNSASTTVTLTSDATITANFVTPSSPGRHFEQKTIDADVIVSLTVESDNCGYCWTKPQTTLSVRKGEAVSIDARTSRREWVAFDRWSVKSGDAVIADSTKGRTTVTVNSDAIVRAEWRPCGSGLTVAQLKAIAVKIDDGKASVKNMPLLIGRDTLKDGPKGSVAIDATVFDMGALTPASGDVVSFVNKDGAKLTLDFKKSLWSFIAPKNLLPSLVASDGILIRLKTGVEESRYALPLHETTTWQTGKSTTIPGLVKAKGSIASKASRSALSLTCSTSVDGVVPDPSQKTFAITVGESLILVPPGEFKSSKGVYSYKFKSKRDTMTVKMDTNKDTMSLDFSGWRWNDLDLLKGISVHASCGEWSKTFTFANDSSIDINRKLYN